MKARGIKRKLHMMIKRIEEETAYFPTNFINDYWNMKLTTTRNFINSNKTPNKVKRQTFQTLIDRAEHLI